MRRAFGLALAMGVAASSASAQAPPTTIVAGLKNPESVVMNSQKEVFVTVIGERAVDGDGGVVKIEGDKAVPYASGMDDPKGMVAHQKSLFVADKNRVWRVDGPGKQLDIAHDLESSPARFHEERRAERHSWRCHDTHRIVEQSGVETTGTDRNSGIQLAQSCQLGRLGARIGYCDLPSERVQIARTRQPRPAEADDDCRGWFCRRYNHRSFRVANPNNTRIREIIQKRTITLGSAQPLSSKW